MGVIPLPSSRPVTRSEAGVTSVRLSSSGLALRRVTGRSDARVVVVGVLPSTYEKTIHAADDESTLMEDAGGSRANWSLR